VERRKLDRNNNKTYREPTLNETSESEATIKSRAGRVAFQHADMGPLPDDAMAALGLRSKN